MIRVYLLKRTESAWLDTKSPKWESVISAGRLKKIARYKPQKEKELALLAELALIYGLKKIDSDVQLPLLFGETESGKPTLLTPVRGSEDIHFNISHSGNIACVAISDRPVGIDVEEIRKRPEKYMRKLLNSAELVEFDRMADENDAQAAEYFCECWVSKEAYMKYTGEGLKVRPETIFTGADERLSFIEAEPGYRMAVFSEVPEQEILLEKISDSLLLQLLQQLGVSL